MDSDVKWKKWAVLILCLSGFTAFSESEQHRRNQLDEMYQQRVSLDQTVWSKEVEAQSYEQVVVRLWDELRAAQNPWEVMAGWPLNSIQLGAQVSDRVVGHGIREMHFFSGRETLSARDWKLYVASWAENGFHIHQSEWHHAGFVHEEDSPPISTFNIALHLTNSATKIRAQVEGQIQIHWTPGEKIADQVEVIHLKVLSRVGDVPFVEVLTLDAEHPPADRAPQGKQGGGARLGHVIVEDFTGDQRPDIALTLINTLMVNQGAMMFEPRQLFAFPPDYHGAAAAVDVTGDGVLDILCGGGAGGELWLFEGHSEKGFAMEPEDINPPDAGTPLASTIAAGDIDADGDVDLWIGQYLHMYRQGQMPQPFFDANDGAPGYLLVNEGQGTFRDGTIEAGLEKKRKRRTYGASFVDVDGDRDLDLWVTSDFAGTDVYLNQGDGRFEDITDRIDGQTRNFGMAHTFGDYNRDGNLDVYVSGMASTTARRLESMGLHRADFPEVAEERMRMAFGNRVYLGNGAGGFSEPLWKEKMNRAGWCWGTRTFDVDHDGNLDTYVVNGNISGGSAQDYCTRYWCHDLYLGTSNPDPLLDDFFQGILSVSINKEQGMSWNGFEKNVLFLNTGPDSYHNVGHIMGVADEFDSRHALAADLDDDGREDLLVVEHERFWQSGRAQRKQTLHVYKNNLLTKNHYIAVTVQGDEHTQPHGAVVRVKSPRGEQVATTVIGDSFKSQHPAQVVFGLGGQREIDEIVIDWPDGRSRMLEKPGVDRNWVVNPPKKPFE